MTLNTRDFSAVGGDQRLPHPDCADVFAGPSSHYFTTPSAALGAHFPNEFNDLLEEFDFPEAPRNYDEIHEAEQELYDRIWYVRSLIHEAQTDDVDALLQIAGPGRARVEAKYGRDNLGPYSDFDWGNAQRKAVGAAMGPRRRVGLSRHVKRASGRDNTTARSVR